MVSELSEAEIGSIIKISQGAERCVVGITNNDVVEDFDFEKLVGSDEIAGNFGVRFRRS